MRIGIDISQIVYEGAGVAKYTKNLVEKLLEVDEENEYILFFSSLRRKFLISNCPAKAWFLSKSKFLNKSRFSTPRYSGEKPSDAVASIPGTKFQLKTFKIPPTFLDILWNRLHIIPIEWFIGPIDVFFSSDWLQPPTIKAKKVTTLHDLSVLKFPDQHHPKIVATQKRRLKWVKEECDLIICDSLATKKDARKILGIEEKKLRVVYPGTQTAIFLKN